VDDLQITTEFKKDPHFLASWPLQSPPIIISTVCQPLSDSVVLRVWESPKLF
jgi:hypothetical protein